MAGKPKSWTTRFEDSLGDLVAQFLRDGMSGSDIQRVLRARVDDDYTALEVEISRAEHARVYGCPAELESEK